MSRPDLVPLVARRVSRGPGPGPGGGRALWLAAALFGSILAASAAEPVANVVGLPFTRFYSFEEIGNVTRGARLGFDPLGRLAVVHGGYYVVLNDSTWIDIGEKERNNPETQCVVFEPSGEAYYGALGSWGFVEITREGLLRQHPLVPASYPKWIMASNFNEIVQTRAGVFFGSFNGVAFWDRTTRQHKFFQMTGASHIFAVGEQAYVSSLTQGILALDVETETLRPAVPPGPGEAPVDQVTTLDRQHVLYSTRDGHLRLFDGRQSIPWKDPLGDPPAGRISALETLTDGRLAIAISGQGLFFASPQGDILSSLTTPEYHRITDLANREPGVLWALTENGVEKILYDSPLTVFGQRLGLTVSWPQVVRWKDQIVLASSGRLYEPLPGPPGVMTRFHLVPKQPSSEIWGIASTGRQLLVGSVAGVFATDEAGEFHSILTNIDASRLVMVNPELCFVVGASEIAVLRRTGERWEEAAPRVPGLGYPSIVHASKRAAWVELGTNRCAQVSLADGRINVRVFENFPWKDQRWANIGIVGDHVVLTGLPDGRLFFDERTGTFVDAPELRELLEHAPHPVARVKEDAAGTIWASYDEGLMTIRRQDGKPSISSAAFLKIADHYPILQLLPDGDVWLGTGQALYHVSRRFGVEAPAKFKPILVSVTDGRSGRSLSPETPGGAIRPLKYGENSLVFQFFAGGYASRQPPAYEFTLHRGPSSWVTLGNGSVLALTDLREGQYRLDARLAEGIDGAGSLPPIEFEIQAPWYRTGIAYFCYVLGAAGAIGGLMRWSAHRTRSRNVVLEKLVQERTNELRLAMEQLNEETRNAATVAERNRLAGEIHDSLQQGLSGLMLQLDATLKLPELADEIRKRLIVARNMVSFTRHEVQHAVWDMETPLLEGTELADALRKIAEFTDPGNARMEISVTGTAPALSPSTKHHLLRIAQEAITNAVRHGAARSIQVALDYGPGSVTLRIADDGNGFVPDDVLTKGIGHFGLRGLRGRVAKINGQLRIESAPGRGTTVSIQVQTAVPNYADVS